MKPSFFSNAQPKRGINNEFSNVENTRNSVRMYFAQAALNEYRFRKGLAYLNQKLAEYPNDPVLVAYEAGFTAIEARYKFFPLDKYQKAMEGIEKIEKSVEAHPNDLEIRFVRLALYDKMPAFFNKKSTAASDARWILQQLSTQDVHIDLKAYINDFMIKNNFVPSQKRTL